MTEITSTIQNRTFRPIYLLYFLMAFVIISILSFSIFKPIKVLPRVSIAPGFAVLNQDNESRTSEDFRGKLTLYGFTYSNCDGDCFQAAPQMKELRELLAQSGIEDVSFALVTISLDPERDDPETLHDFAASYLGESDNPVSWDFLTGDPMRMKFITGGGFGMFYEPTDEDSATGDYEIEFYPRFVLVDGWGIIRAQYLTADLDYDQVLEDINYLTDEIANSQGAAKYAYEAAHLFRCYP